MCTKPSSSYNMTISPRPESPAVEKQPALSTIEATTANSPESPEHASPHIPEPPSPIQDTLELKNEFIKIELTARGSTNDPIPQFSGNHHDTCLICYEPTSPGRSDLTNANALLKLPCGHAFGWLCWATWLRSSSACPLCRRPCSPFLGLEVDLTPWTCSQIRAAREYPVPDSKPDDGYYDAADAYTAQWRGIIYGPDEQRQVTVSCSQLVGALQEVVGSLLIEDVTQMEWWVAVYMKLRAGIEVYWRNRWPDNEPECETDMAFHVYCDLQDGLRRLGFVNEEMLGYLMWVMVEVWMDDMGLGCPLVGERRRTTF